MVRRKDSQNRLIFTDISDPSFLPKEHSLMELMCEIHGRRPDGSYVKGVEVFREIYDRIGFGFIVGPTRLPLIRNLLDMAYQVFARLRYASAKRRMSKQSSCKTETCRLPASKPSNS